MFGEDDIDFTPSTKTNLASLFSSARSSPTNGNQSLTYKAPKQPKSKPKHETPTDSDSSMDFRKPKPDSMEGKLVEKPRTPNTLDLLAVKTIQAFKMENGNYNNVGRLRAALCGSFVNRYFELLVYRDKTTHVCRATVNKNFKFIVQMNNYAAFYDKVNQLWSVLFEAAEDAVEFCTQIALVKWCCLVDSGKGNELLVQNLVMGPNDQQKAEEGSVVDIYYVAKTVAPDFKIVREVANNHNDGQPISVTVGAGWEKGLNGVSVNSKRVIIIPYSLLGSWKPLVADEFSLMLQLTVIKVSVGQSQPSGKQNFDFLRSGCTDGGIDENVNDKVVPRVCRPSSGSKNTRPGFPNFNLQDKVPHSNDSESESEEDSSVIPKTGHNSKQKNKSFHSHINKKRGYNSHGTHDELVSPTQSQQIDPYGSFIHGPLSSSQPLSAESHMSVYLSEMRIQNSEVRIGLGRVSDKVDQVLTKLEPKSVIDLNSLDDKIEKLTEINKEIKNKVSADFSTIESQFKEIISLLKKKTDEPRAGDRIQKSALLTEGATEMGQFESRSTELETENSGLKTMLTQTLRENNNLKMHVATLEHVNTQLRDELLNASSEETNDSKMNLDANLKEEIKQKMNVIYQSLKSQFCPDKQYLGQEIHTQLYNTIKCVTLEYLQEKRGDNMSSSSTKRNEVIENKAKLHESKPGTPVPFIDPPTFNETATKQTDHTKKIIALDSGQTFSEEGDCNSSVFVNQL